MPISDTKKVQTLLNAVADQAQIVRDAVATMKAMRTLFNTASPDVTGTPLDGNTAAVSGAIDNLDTEISKALWTQMIAAKVPSHSGDAL